MPTSFSLVSESFASSSEDARGFLTPRSHRQALRLAFNELNEANARTKRVRQPSELSVPVLVAMRCLALGRSLAAAFTPVTNPVKLANGHSAHAARDNAVRRLAKGRARAEVSAVLHRLTADGAENPIDLKSFEESLVREARRIHASGASV